MKATLSQSEAEIQAACEVLLELRTQYNKTSILEAVKAQMEQGYQLAYVEHQEKVMAVAGFVISYKLAWGKHIYVDDLVTRPDQTAKGYGAYLMNWLKEYGREQDCQQLHLDSGVQRFDAHRFYMKQGFKIASHHFSLML